MRRVHFRRENGARRRAVVAHPDCGAASGAIRIEPFAIIQAVAVGIGFLGSGIVFISHAESRVHGLTTAASVWATAAMGLTVGFGRFFLAVGATVLLLIALRGLRRFDHTRHQE